MNEVYIGNGQTVQVEHNKDFMNYLDMDKLKSIYEENKDKSVYVGASGDWYFTAQKVTEETFAGYNQSLLKASSWSTFKVEIDGQETIDVTHRTGRKDSKLAFNDGFLKGIYKIEFWLHGLYSEVISKLEYKDIKAMVEEIKPIVEKYKTKTITR